LGALDDIMLEELGNAQTVRIGRLGAPDRAREACSEEAPGTHSGHGCGDRHCRQASERRFPESAAGKDQGGTAVGSESQATAGGLSDGAGALLERLPPRLDVVVQSIVRRRRLAGGALRICVSCVSRLGGLRAHSMRSRLTRVNLAVVVTLATLLPNCCGAGHQCLYSPSRVKSARASRLS
jgi:hypothetical protein